MSLITSGSVPIPQRLWGSGELSTNPIQADPAAGTAPTRITLTVDYTMVDDSGAFSRPNVAGLTYPLIFAAGTTATFSFCEAQALAQAGAARFA